MTTAKRKLSPSQRLKATKPKAATSEAAASTNVTFPDLTAPTVMKIRSKWLVHEKREVPELVDGVMRTRWLVHLKAVYEPRSVLHGQATVQGCLDNRMFGAGMPEADMVMKIDLKAIADTYQVGRAFVQEHTEVLPEPLW